MITITKLENIYSRVVINNPAATKLPVYLCHNAWDKVRHDELTKSAELQTKNAESNKSP